VSGNRGSAEAVRVPSASRGQLGSKTECLEHESDPNNVGSRGEGASSKRTLSRRPDQQSGLAKGEIAGEKSGLTPQQARMTPIHAQQHRASVWSFLPVVLTDFQSIPRLDFGSGVVAGCLCSLARAFGRGGFLAICFLPEVSIRLSVFGISEHASNFARTLDSLVAHMQLCRDCII
jgi:hypothetical protein